MRRKGGQILCEYALVPPVLVHKLGLHDPEDIATRFEVSHEAARYAYSYYQKWLQYGGTEYTSYEIKLLKLFREVA